MLKNARYFSACFLVLLSFVLGGCQTKHVCDARGESGDFCEIHHTYMETKVIDNKKNWPDVSPEYLEARTRFFRHSYPFILPDQCDKVAVYVCEECVQAEREWKRKHGEK